MPSTAITYPLGGLDDREPTVIEAARSPDLRNVRTVRERVVAGPGSALWATAPAAVLPRTFAQVEFLAGAQQELMFTQTQVYKWGGASWTLLGGGPYTGAASARFSAVATQDRVCWSNGVDNIKVYDGTAAPTQLVAIAAPTLLAFNNRVLALNPTEVDGLHNARVRWSVNGVITDWTGLGSGFLEVIQTGDAPLTGGFVLGNQCMLTKERELIELVATGDAASPFAEASSRGGGAHVAGTGMIARYSPGLAEYLVFFLGPDDVYAWDGASLVPVGTRVYKTITSLVDYTALTKVQGVVHTTDSEYWLLVSETAEGGVFIYDYRRDRWFRDDWPNVRALGVFRIGSNLLTVIQQSEFVIAGYLDGSSDRVDPRLSQRRGANFSSYITTTDTEAKPAQQKPGVKETLLDRNTLWRIRVRADTNEAVTIGYSKDRGSTWNEVVATANADGVATYDVIDTFSIIRHRLKTTGSATLWELFRGAEMVWSGGGYEL